MLISEILNKKIDYDVIRQTATGFAAEATIGDRIIKFKASASGDNVWEVAFVEIRDTASGSTHATYSKTNSGNELEVFSMIKDCMLELIDRYSPNKIAFTADKDSGKDNLARGDVYERMLKRFSIPKYTWSRSDEGKHDQFVLTRKEAN